PPPKVLPSGAEFSAADPVRVTSLSVRLALRSASITLTATAPPTPAAPPAADRLKAMDQMLAPRSGWLALIDRSRALRTTFSIPALVVSAFRLKVIAPPTADPLPDPCPDSAAGTMRLFCPAATAGALS